MWFGFQNYVACTKSSYNDSQCLGGLSNGSNSRTPRSGALHIGGREETESIARKVRDRFGGVDAIWKDDALNCNMAHRYQHLIRILAFFFGLTLSTHSLCRVYNHAEV